VRVLAWTAYRDKKVVGVFIAFSCALHRKADADLKGRVVFKKPREPEAGCAGVEGLTHMDMGIVVMVAAQNIPLLEHFG
jgi:hypothetical protein